jgi:Mrp family chromosome partitioning ATPase
MPRSDSAAESYGKAALVLARAVQEGRYRSVLFSSPGPGAGTTTAMLQIARELQRAYGLTALTVELGRRRPAFERRFGVDSARGVAALAAEEKSVHECVQRGRSGLWMLPSGPEEYDHAPPRGLSAAIERILAETTGKFDLVLFDAPPLLEQSVGLTAGTVVPRLVLVAEAGRTSHEVLDRVKRELDAEGIEIVGAILNKQPRYIPGWLYGWVTR